MNWYSYLSSNTWILLSFKVATFLEKKGCCTLYKTQVKVCKDAVSATQEDSLPNLWHRQLSHTSEKRLQILAKKSLIPFAKGMSLKHCDYCLFGKQHRVSFCIPSIRKPNVLDLVYFDVCDPIDVKSLSGNKYFVTFIDDFSRKVFEN